MEEKHTAEKKSAVSETTKDTSGLATASLVLGLVGMVAWILPIIGFPVQVVGLVFSIKGRTSVKKKMATAGMILCIIGLVFTLLNAVAGAYLASTGQYDMLTQ